MSVYAIPPHHPFLTSFVAGLKRRHPDALDLGRCIILLPTKRGCLTLKEELKGQMTVLPRVFALSDLEEQPLLPGFVGSPMLPAIPHLQRLGILTQLICAYAKSQNTPINYTSALLQAEELATLLDEFHTSDCSLDKISNLVADSFASYWQVTVKFLEIITNQWPKILADLGYCEPAIRKREHLRQIAKTWQPSVPVYLIGTTGTRPATAELAKAILNLKDGHVVLPGCDRDILEEKLPVTHPQFTLKMFTRFLDQEVYDWAQEDKKDSASQLLLREVMAPTINHKLDLKMDRLESIPELINCQSIDEEIAVISLIIRHTLASESKTVTVITPDQRLTKRLHQYLKRWKITANTSLGQSLQSTAAGQFISLITQIHPRMQASSWLSLLKHPFFYRAKERIEHLKCVRQFELSYLRQDIPQPLFQNAKVPSELESWYQEILTIISPLLQSQPTDSVSSHSQKLREIVINLYGNDDIWQESDGESISNIINDLQTHSSAFGNIGWSDYGQILNNLVKQQTIHDIAGIGSRVQILGTLEARQFKADITILAGLNEKVWPGQPDSGSWLNRQMRLQLGLPDPERKIGLAGHDFCLAWNTGEKVYLTRSEKDNGTATIPSRWWVRLHTIYTKYGLKSDSPVNWLQLAKSLDQRPLITGKAPEPRPSLIARPTTFTATDIELLMRDPYSYYAKRILKLKKLPEIQTQLSTRNFGQLVHSTIDNYQRQKSEKEPCLQTLLTYGKKQFSVIEDNTVAHTFWWSRFERIAEWLITQWQHRLTNLQASYSEIKGSIPYQINDQQLTLTAIADRIDVLDDNTCLILDYKTGTPPTYKDIQLGLSPQLPIEALILDHGGFFTTSSSSCPTLEYWHLQGNIGGGNITTLKQPEKLIYDCYRGVEALLTHFYNDGSCYISCPWGKEKTKLSDYLQLARVQEWL